MGEYISEHWSYPLFRHSAKKHLIIKTKKVKRIFILSFPVLLNFSLSRDDSWNCKLIIEHARLNTSYLLSYAEPLVVQFVSISLW